ncbi:E3 ubiquitin-protein ligase SIAH1 [Cryptotermes secundus]|uniref:E3 ubiquitin-protein ligase n=1 Tax=Cryptotermes secundus TaxID=105785 RepID=A0A2J7RDR6_9NEOP|nr:E3 ubiquitin-protein ligase SIAH1A [Cryptotermes secundus]PNF38977.1 E3 ubiquitin-protein ligase SIAH1 [Cryptotermes secundus]
MDHNSTSAKATKARTVSGDIARLYECRACSDYFQPPVLQCHKGHLICSKCRSKDSCPKCRAPLGNIRKFEMKEFVRAVTFPCKYSPSGCAVALLRTEMREHEEACEFRPYPCPFQVLYGHCEWQGCLKKMMPHIMTSHKSIKTLQGEDVVFTASDIDQPGAGYWVKMQTCFGHHFRLLLDNHMSLDGCEQFFVIVQLIGSRKQAEKFVYRLELEGQRKHLTWESTPRSILEPIFAIIMRSDCLRFGAPTCKRLAYYGNLRIHVSIRMV